MELQRGIPLLWQQFTSLFKKNLLLAWRSKVATFVRLFSSLFFLFLLFCINKSGGGVGTGYDPHSLFKDVPDPKSLVSPPIPPCEDKFFIQKPCLDFVWSGNGSAAVSRIVSRILANNPGRPIPDSKVMSFRTTEEVDAWLLDNPGRCPGALHFKEINETAISYGIQTNSSTVGNHGFYEDPTFTYQIPLQISAEREISRTLLGDQNFTWVVGLKQFPHPAEVREKPTNIIDGMAPMFLFAFAMFGFVTHSGNLLMEKDLKLRQAMNMTGLYDSAYWFSWITWEAVMALISSLFLVLFGLMFQLDMFKKNGFAILFLLFFLFQLNMSGFAFLISNFVSKPSSATTLGFLVFIIGSITQSLSEVIYHLRALKWRILWSFFPPNLLGAALYFLSSATHNTEGTDGGGISWSKRAKCFPADDTCEMTINGVYRWLTGTYFLWLVLAIYLDNIFPNASGVRKSILYFLTPWYWTGRGGNKFEEGGICSCMGSVPQLERITPGDEDVLEEENIVKQDVREGKVDPDVAVQIRGLVKTYAGTTEIGCCRCKRNSPYHAVKGLWVNFTKDQLFCLLGPNGAGKTTIISCLTGKSPATGGDALIYENSIRSAVGMSNIRRLIGVCPQFDILWDVLTGVEHLQLFASIKGLPPSSIDLVARELLEKVKLTQAATRRSRSYSGGMRRRLSVAIALIGDPKLLILDEPTTGMDPITRRYVWDIIQNAKRGRAIVLTTHSMEEADVLSDRIGIMAKGRLRCIGNSIRLKSKFGTGFIANMNFIDVPNERNTPNGQLNSSPHHEAVKQFLRDHLNVTPTEETKSYMTFVIPHDKEMLLTNFFAELQDRQREFGIADIQLGLATLEEVFLNIAMQAELEAATAERRMATLSLTSGAQIEIPVGARFVAIPRSETSEAPRGSMVEVFWEQDDSGALCISGHSEEMPVPPHVQHLIPTPGRRTLGRNRGPAYGTVIDPNQIANGH